MKRTLVLFPVMLCAMASSLRSEAIIIDHTCTDESLIPDNWISSAAQVRSMMRHCSILQDLGSISYGLNGLDALKAKDPKYDWTNFKFYGVWHPGAEARINDLYDDDVIMEAPGSCVDHWYDQIDVFGFYVYEGEYWSGISSFEYQDWNAHWIYFRDRMLAIEAKYPQKKFVWCILTVDA